MVTVASVAAVTAVILCCNEPLSIMMLQRATTLCPKLTPLCLSSRQFHVSPVCERVQAARYKITPKRDRPLTYEMANPPHFIGDRKAWNSWNVSSLKDGIRSSETTIEDIFIRKFMTGTFHSLVCSEVIIKRQHNHIRIAAILRQGITARKMYFLIGYTEELLSSWLQCPVTLELQTVADRKEVVFKYI